MQAIVTMVYHTKLGEPWTAAALELKETLNVRTLVVHPRI
jgi:hypothetical protein